MLLYGKRLQPHHFYVGGQLMLGACLLVCLILIPNYFFSLNQGGISNYGTEPQTKWLFAIGFSAATIGTLLAAVLLPRRTQRQLQFMLVILAALYLVVMISTFSYKLSPSLRHLHEQSAVVLLAGMLFTSIWLRFAGLKDAFTNRVFIIFCFSLALGLPSALGLLHILFALEVASGVSFALLLAHGLRVLTDQR